MTPSTHLEKAPWSQWLWHVDAPSLAAICPGYREALEGVLLSKMCTALKEPILIEWGHSVYPLQESSFGLLASVVANACLLPPAPWAQGVWKALQCRMLTSKRQNLCHE
jgi:hypothetical protein